MSTQRPSPRPRFDLRSKLGPQEIAARLKAHLRTSKSMRGVALPDRIELSWAGEELRFWSPQLVADVRPEGDGAHLSARFGPDPYVWGMYVLTYLALGFLTLMAAAYGVAQLTLGQTPTALYAAPGGAVLAGLVYGASFVGQGLGSDQMYQLRATLVEMAEAYEHEPRAGSRPSLPPAPGGPEG